MKTINDLIDIMLDIVPETCTEKGCTYCYFCHWLVQVSTEYIEREGVI